MQVLVSSRTKSLDTMLGYLGIVIGPEALPQPLNANGKNDLAEQMSSHSLLGVLGVSKDLLLALRRFPAKAYPDTWFTKQQEV